MLTRPIGSFLSFSFYTPGVRIPELPEAIAHRVVPVNYAHISCLLYGYDSTALTKRISGWRRSDADFPPALSGGRSPAFDAKEVWRWLTRKARSADGRTQASLNDMTHLQPNTLGAVARRHWLLASVALRHETGDVQARHWMTALAALQGIRLGTSGALGPGIKPHVVTSPAAQLLLEQACDERLDAQSFMLRSAKALKGNRATAHNDREAVRPLDVLSQFEVPTDLRVLAAGALSEISPELVSTFADLVFDSDEGSVSTHLDTTSTSAEAVQFIAGLVASLAEALGRTWTSAYDPAAGEGNVLAALAAHHPWEVYGQDADANALQLAGARLLTTHAAVDLRLTHDTIGSDRFPGLLVDVVVADPPQPARRQRAHDHLDEWWRHIHAKLANEQSLAFVLTSDQPQAQPSDEVIASGHVLAVIETGQRLRRDTPGHTVLWVLTPQRMNRVVRIAVRDSSRSTNGWIESLMAPAVVAIAGLQTGASTSAFTTTQVPVWVASANDAELIRPIGPDGWPDDLDRLEKVAQLRAHYLDALASLPASLRHDEISVLESSVRSQDTEATPSVAEPRLT